MPDENFTKAPSTLNYDVSLNDLNSRSKHSECPDIINEFLESGAEIAEIVFDPIAYRHSINSVYNAYYSCIKKELKNELVRVSVRKNRIFLVRIK